MMKRRTVLAVRRFFETALGRKRVFFMLEFRKQTKEDIKMIRFMTEKYGYGTCDYTVCGIYLWREHYGYEICFQNNTLFVKGVDENGDAFFLCPMGETDICDAVSAVKEYCNALDLKKRFLFVPENVVSAITDEKKEAVEGWSDYVYGKKEFVELRGKELHKKKNRINKFIAKNPDWRYEPMNDGNIGIAKLFFEDKFGDSYFDPMLISEQRIIKALPEDFESLGMCGGLLFSAERCVGFAVGDRVRDTLYVHFEKADKELDGCYEMLSNCFAKGSEESVSVINREEDMGNEGLRRAKRAYAPKEMLKKYAVTF